MRTPNEMAGILRGEAKGFEGFVGKNISVTPELLEQLQATSAEAADMIADLGLGMEHMAGVLMECRDVFSAAIIDLDAAQRFSGGAMAMEARVRLNRLRVLVDQVNEALGEMQKVGKPREPMMKPEAA